MSSIKTRVIVNNCVSYEGIAYPHEELRYRNGERVLVEEIIEVSTEKKMLMVYDEDEEVICEIEIGRVKAIGEVA
jgi:carbamoylphosphate synthase large subunit